MIVYHKCICGAEFKVEDYDAPYCHEQMRSMMKDHTMFCEHAQQYQHPGLNPEFIRDIMERVEKKRGSGR